MKLFSLLIAAAALAVVPAVAQDAARVEFPDYKAPGFFRYFVVNDAANNRVYEVFAETDVLNNAMTDMPLDDGAVIVMERYEAVLDGNGAPALDEFGDFARSRRLDVWVMERRAGWDDDGGAGDWEFAAFRPSGSRLNLDAGECHACHEAAAEADYVFTFGELEAEGWIMPE